MSTHLQKTPNRGMTLLELAIVILVLLSLISILFIGARAWKKGCDRSANIVNIRNVQLAVRSHQNIREMDFGAPLAKAAIFDDSYLKEPLSPHGSSYEYLGGVPPLGTLYISNPAVDGADYWYPAAEAIAKTSGW